MTELDFPTRWRFHKDKTLHPGPTPLAAAQYGPTRRSIGRPDAGQRHGDPCNIAPYFGHCVWTADNPVGRAMIGGEWHVTFVESFILVKTPTGWRIAFGHTSQLPADFGVDPDYQAEHGGMKLVKVLEDGPAGKAGFKSGDVLIEYGGRKIDNYVDYSRLVHAYSEGEKVMVTVLRGHEKIMKEVTLEQMK